MAPQMTGFPMGGAAPIGQGGGFMQPQMTGQMAFGNMGQQQPQQQIHQPAFGQSTPQQPTQSQQTGFLQPQQTGSNPFRQSMMMGQPTGMGGMGMGQFGAGVGGSTPASPFGSMNANSSQNSAGGAFGSTNPIARPGSTPVGGSAMVRKPLTAQTTGSRNPFAPAGGVPMPQQQQKEKGPSMNELAAGRFGSMNSNQGQGQGQMSTNGGGGGGMADVASSFTSDQAGKGGQPDFMSQFGGLSVNTSNSNGTNPMGSMSTGTSNATSNFGNSLFSNPTNTSSSISSPTSPSAGGFLQPQKTGFGGSAIKPFKPSSSFGSQLMADLGSVPEAGQPGGAAFQISTNNTGGGQFGQMSPQLTGAGSNPFRQSMMGQQTGMGMGTQQTGMGGMGQNGMGMGGAQNGQGMGMGQGAFGASSPFAGQNRGMGMGGFGQGQGQQGGSLI